jgi:hypothetical protein
MTEATTAHINDLRAHLMETLADLRNRANPMEPDRARAIANVASVLVDTARVEVDFIRATARTESAFLADKAGADVPAIRHTATGTVFKGGGVTRHQLAG